MKKMKISCVLILILSFMSAGVVRADALPNLKPTLSEVETVSKQLYVIWRDGKYGFIDSTGKEIIKAVYDGAGSDYVHGQSVYVIDRSKGIQVYYDANGNELFECQINQCSYLSEGMAVYEQKVMQSDGTYVKRYGYVNDKGRQVVEPVFHRASHFKEGLARVNMGKAGGYIDKNGAQAIPLRFSSTTDFSEGLAVVQLTVRGKYAYIDKLGKVVIPARFAYAGPFSDGAAVVNVNGKYGYIDRMGKYILTPQFTAAQPFSEGLAFVERNGKSFYIDKQGKKKILNLTAGGRFVDGLAPASTGQKYGFINKTGKFVVKADLEWADSFVGDLAWVYVKLNETPQGTDGYIEGYMNKQGELIWTGVRN